jgi:hypothetical protein
MLTSRGPLVALAHLVCRAHLPCTSSIATRLYNSPTSFASGASTRTSRAARTSRAPPALLPDSPAPLPDHYPSLHLSKLVTKFGNSTRFRPFPHDAKTFVLTVGNSELKYSIN